MSEGDKPQIGLTPRTHEVLSRLKEENVFNEMQDGYRFGIAFAMAKGYLAPEGLSTRTTFSTSTLDPNRLIHDAIVELYPEAANRPYAFAERLAEGGVSELGRLYDAKQLRFGDIFALVAED